MTPGHLQERIGIAARSRLGSAFDGPPGIAQGTGKIVGDAEIMQRVQLARLRGDGIPFDGGRQVALHAPAAAEIVRVMLCSADIAGLRSAAQIVRGPREVALRAAPVAYHQACLSHGFGIACVRGRDVPAQSGRFVLCDAGRAARRIRGSSRGKEWLARTPPRRPARTSDGPRPHRQRRLGRAGRRCRCGTSRRHLPLPPQRGTSAAPRSSPARRPPPLRGNSQIVHRDGIAPLGREAEKLKPPRALS